MCQVEVMTIIALALVLARRGRSATSDKPAF
jgi:hypothetical protein